jgi:pyruvate formate lyase activating enzyme
VKRIVEDDLVDYFAIDIKTSFSKYHLVNAPLSALERVLETVHLIIRRGKKLELRTTVVPEIVESGDFERIIEDLNEKSAEILANVVRYSVQAFRPQKCMDKYFEGVKPYEDEVLEEIALKLRKHVNKVDILK